MTDYDGRMVQWNQAVSIRGEENNAQAGMGMSLSKDGKTIAVGCPFQNEYDVYGGRVRVFRQGEEGWKQIGGNIDGKDNNTGTSGEFISLSADGNTIALDNKDVFVYSYDGSEWSQLGDAIPVKKDDKDRAARICLSDDGKTVVFEGRKEGEIYTIAYLKVYKYKDGEWTQVGDEITGDEGDSSKWGLSLSGDGQTVAIGCMQRMHVYRLNDGKWEQLGANIELEGFTKHVALSGDGNIVAGSTLYPYERFNVYRYDGSEWREMKIEDKDDLCKYMACAVSGDGTTLAVAGRDGPDKVMNAEVVRAWKLVDGVWKKYGREDILGGMEDEFGYNLDLSNDGERLAAGAPKNCKNGERYEESGEVYVYATGANPRYGA